MQNNLLFEMLPLVVFFAVYHFSRNIYLATSVLIIASWLQLIWCKAKYRHISKNTWISTILITTFGGLTIILHNKTFIMLKPTVLFWILGSVLLIGQVMGKNSIKLMLGKELSVADAVWNKLNTAWGVFFLFMGGLNLFVALNFSEYIWVKFKVFGSFGLMLVFILISVAYIFVVRKKNRHV